MSGWLPPGVTDKDIDDAINGDGTLVQCDCCGAMVFREDAVFVRYDHPNSNAPCDTTVCPKCRGEDEEDDSD
jgi:hypothetical protein